MMLGSCVMELRPEKHYWPLGIVDWLRNSLVLRNKFLLFVNPCQNIVLNTLLL